MYTSQTNIAGLPPISLQGLAADTVQRLARGEIVTAHDPYWGTGEFVYAQASGSIRAQGLCTLSSAFDSTRNRWTAVATEVANTANQGVDVCVAMQPLVANSWGWFLITGIVPVNSNAAVAAGAVGIGAAGQAGALSNGKQLLSASSLGSSATTVVKANAQAANGSVVLQVSDSDGWFQGVYLSGTGIAAGTTVNSIDASGRFVTLSAATTAQVNGSVTATYNNGTVYFNVLDIARAHVQGQIV